MRRLLVAALLLASVACSSAATTAGSGNARDLITESQIRTARVPGWFTYELIDRLRPHFLKPHNAVTLREPDPIFADVYVNEIYHGDLESLKTLPIDGIKTIQFLPPFDAATRFGKEMPGGAILIRTL